MSINENFYQTIGYPKAWLEEAKKYGPHESYVIYDPSWDEPIETIPRASIYDLFKTNVEKNPDHPALIFLDRAISYGRLDLMINKFAALLLELGVRKGDFVGVMLPNSPQHWIAFYAAARIGAIHAPINVMYKLEEISYQLKDCGAKTLVILDLFYPYFAKLKGELNLENIIVTNLRELAAPDFEPYETLKPFWAAPKKKIEGTIDFLESLERYSPTKVKVDLDFPQDVAQIIYTAGTTGKSKGAMQTHLNMVHNSVTHALLCKCTGKPVNYSVLPMFHTGGFFLFPLPTLYRGGTVITVPIFDPVNALQLIEKYKVNVLFGSPTLYVALLQQPGLKDFDLSSLQTTAAGAAPVPEELTAAWQAQAGRTLDVGWGMTELNTAGSYNMLKNRKKPSTIGSPLVGEIKIVDAEGKTAPRGQIGEILYRGLQVSKGYFNKPEETKACFLPDGWFRTGDAGSMDEEGFVHFSDRIKDLVIASGYNIAPVEVEYAILKHPGVLDVAVVGIPHEYRGETVKAFIVLRNEFKGKVSEQEITKFCQERLATFKVPKKVEFVDELPKNALGKTLRRVLREQELSKAH
jgi:long-chain acyl-CoA synthetase